MFVSLHSYFFTIIPFYLLTSVAYLQGTGTKIGDLEEMTALAATIGQSHSADNKLIVGSVKSNVG